MTELNHFGEVVSEERYVMHKMGIEDLESQAAFLSRVPPETIADLAVHYDRLEVYPHKQAAAPARFCYAWSELRKHQSEHPSRPQLPFWLVVQAVDLRFAIERLCAAYPRHFKTKSAVVTVRAAKGQSNAIVPALTLRLRPNKFKRKITFKWETLRSGVDHGYLLKGYAELNDDSRTAEKKFRRLVDRDPPLSWIRPFRGMHASAGLSRIYFTNQRSLAS